MSPVVRSVLSSIDLIKLWSVGLQILGMAIVARKTVMQSAVVIGSLWLLGVLLGGVAAAFG